MNVAKLNKMTPLGELFCLVRRPRSYQRHPFLADMAESLNDFGSLEQERSGSFRNYRRNWREIWREAEKSDCHLNQLQKTSDHHLHEIWPCKMPIFLSCSPLNTTITLKLNLVVFLSLKSITVTTITVLSAKLHIVPSLSHSPAE